jgi:catechol 2,3-dioxygenase-like lactoylglutathione lyase family enzyme
MNDNNLLVLRHDHVALRVVDYDATVRWYTEKLDFHVDAEWPFGDMRLAYLSNGTAKIEVLGGSKATPQPPTTTLDDSFGVEGLHHFCLAVDDLDATIATLVARDVPLLGEPFVVAEIGRRLAFLVDNSGNRIELSAPAA